MSNIEENLDNICRLIVKKRDYGKLCIICGKGEMGKFDVVCHLFKRRHLGTRWMLHNLHLGHFECNCKEEQNSLLAVEHLKNVQSLLSESEFNRMSWAKNSNVKFSESDKKELLKELNIYYKKLLNGEY